jgi:hypothetical protein
MSKIKPQDHPDYVGGWVWTKLELDWINERIDPLEAALFQAQEAAKDLEARLTKTEGWLNEAMWNYGELKREQLANQEKTFIILEAIKRILPFAEDNCFQYGCNADEDEDIVFARSAIFKATGKA